MATVKIHAPNAGFTGVRAGVVFKNGVGELDGKTEKSALAYFKRQGYGIGKDKPEPEPEVERVDAREASHTQLGTPLRDAAVDPEKSDFLAPINAGKADPHGPTVVSPEIHGSGPKGIKPGDVHVDEPAKQEADEKALAKAVLIENQPHAVANAQVSDEPSAMPARSASQKAWAAWAVSQGMDAAEAEAMTRKELIERHGGEG